MEIERMQTNQKLLLDDLISQVLYFNEQDAAFGGVLRITATGVSLYTHNNIWGTKTTFTETLNSEEDLRDMIIWIKDQFRRSSAGQKIHKFGLYSEPNEEMRDLEDDLKRGIR
jgi:hypothetical protein